MGASCLEVGWMVGSILTNVMTKDVLMSRKIGFGKGQAFFGIW